MKKMILVAVLIALLVSGLVLPRIIENWKSAASTNIKILLVYNPSNMQAAQEILPAYESVLQEEGIPYRKIDAYELANLVVEDIVATTPAIILPDAVLQTAPTQLGEWTKAYLSKGGNVVVVYDAGVKHQKGHYIEQAVFTDIVGLNYITFRQHGDAAFDHGYMRFSTEAARDFFQIPLGKTVDRVTVSGYGYGALEYPIWRTEKGRDLKESDIYAYAINGAGEQFPLLVLRDYGQGKVLYANLPLGHLKANSDDLLLRSTLRTFLFDVVNIPHVMNVENGQGGIVINWHIDSSTEHTILPQMEEWGLFREGLKASFHISAGDFLDQPGDGEGFDVTGTGRDLVKHIKPYGSIGSHGGWAHNWFAQNIEDGNFGEAEIKEYISKNNAAVEEVTGEKVLEYSAPNGVHPQPVATQVLTDLGIMAYYYTGDTGSAPNRTFSDGKMLFPKTIAFPVMPFGKTASLWEMRVKDHKTAAEVQEWFSSIADYSARNRTVRLMYSHPRDVEEYPAVVKSFIDKVEQLYNQKQLAVRSMSDFTKFFLRFLETEYQFERQGKQLVIQLAHPVTLQGLTIAIPKKQYKKPVEVDLFVQEDERYYYLSVVGQGETKKRIAVDGL